MFEVSVNCTVSGATTRDVKLAAIRSVLTKAGTVRVLGECEASVTRSVTA
jgi:hypothetical protein